MFRVVALWVLVASVVSAAPEADSVTLRSGAVRSPVESISFAGVQVGGTNAGDVSRTIPWGTVRRLGSAWSSQAFPYTGLADTAWRARVRLLRSDWYGASVLYERLWSDRIEPLVERAAAPWEYGPTGLSIAESTMASRLRRGTPVDALGPWLLAQRLRAAGTLWDERPEAIASLWRDDSSLVLPIMPVLTAAHAARVLASEPALSLLAGPSGPAHARLALLLRVAAFEAYGQTSSSDETAGLLAAAGPAWSSAAVARCGEGSLRDNAIEQLIEGLGDGLGDGLGRGSLHADPQQEAWLRVALGRALLRDSEARTRRRGVVHLLHVPARLSDAAPALSRTSLALAIAVLQEDGVSDAGVESLRALLTELDPHRTTACWSDPVVPPVFRE